MATPCPSANGEANAPDLDKLHDLVARGVVGRLVAILADTEPGAVEVVLGHERVIAAATRKAIGNPIEAAVQVVIAFAAVELIEASLAVEVIVAAIAKEEVGASTTVEPVISAADLVAACLFVALRDGLFPCPPRCPGEKSPADRYIYPSRIPTKVGSKMAKLGWGPVAILGKT